MKLSDEIRSYKTNLIRYALKLEHGNIRAAARQLGESPGRIQRWVHALGLGDFAADLRRRRAWWLVERSLLVGAFLTMVVYAAHALV
jgi:hypothetical protein